MNPSLLTDAVPRGAGNLLFFVYDDDFVAGERIDVLGAGRSTPAQPETSPILEEKPRENSATIGEWNPFASFVVEFQVRVHDGWTEDRRTAVHYVEADRNEMWPGYTSVPLESIYSHAIMNIRRSNVDAERSEIYGRPF